MTPSPEALAAGRRLRERHNDLDDSDARHIAEVIDIEHRAYRERVRRLVEATTDVDQLAILAQSLEHEHRCKQRGDIVNQIMEIEKAVAEARAALAPFLEQETAQ